MSTNREQVGNSRGIVFALLTANAVEVDVSGLMGSVVSVHSTTGGGLLAYAFGPAGEDPDEYLKLVPTDGVADGVPTFYASGYIVEPVRISSPSLYAKIITDAYWSGGEDGIGVIRVVEPAQWPPSE